MQCRQLLFRHSRKRIPTCARVRAAHVLCKGFTRTHKGLSWSRIAREVDRWGACVRTVPPGKPARYMALPRGRTRLSPATATARSSRQCRYALIPVHSCYIALCANSRCFCLFTYEATLSFTETNGWAECCAQVKSSMVSDSARQGDK